MDEVKKGRPVSVVDSSTRSMTFGGVMWSQIDKLSKQWSKKLNRPVSPSEVCRKIWDDYQNEVLYSKLKKEC